MRARPPGRLRHGRHHREDLPDRRRGAAAFPQLRGRAPLPLPQGQRHPAAHPGDRDGGDRRRRRLHRLCGPALAHPGRTGERGLGARARLLRPRRHAADRHRCRPGDRAAAAGPLRRRAHPAGRWGRGRGRAAACRRGARPRAHGRGARHRGGGGGEHGECRAAACRGTRQGAAGPRHGGLRRRGAAARRAAGREARHRHRARAGGCRRGLGGRLPAGPDRL